MAFLFELLFELFGEVLLQIVFEVLADSKAHDQSVARAKLEAR
jgi:hypothetical protein